MATLVLANKISASSNRMLKQNILQSNLGNNLWDFAPYGINNMYEEWSVSWNFLSLTDRNTWMAFWDTYGLTTAFYWAPLKGSAGGYRFIEGPTESNVGDFYNISIKLRYFPDTNSEV